ncbi:MAG: TonB-dependent receptor [Planctomycetes bacterium]|nr:TonB-dependent receptor [Planctomycetota bacterium]
MVRTIGFGFIALLAAVWPAFAQGGQDRLERALVEERGRGGAADDALQDGVRQLEETIVTATLDERSPHLAGRSSSVLDGVKLEIRRAPATLPDALRQVPGLMIQKTGPGLGSPYIRGFTGFRTVLLVDGIRINNSVFRDGPNQYWNTVDALGLGQIEVVRGPASMLWGSDAAGGVVHARTPTVDLGREGEGTSGGGRLYYRYNTAEYSHIGRIEGNVAHDGRFGARVGVSYKSFGELDEGGGHGDQEGTAHDAYFFDAKMRYLVADDFELEFLFQSVHLNNVPRIHATAQSSSYNGTSIGSDRRREFDQDRDLALLTGRVTDGSFFEELVVRLGYQTQDEVQDRIRSNGRRERAGFDVETFILTGQFLSETAIGALTYGLDLYVDLVDSAANRYTPGTGAYVEFAQGPVADDSSYLTLGLFVQDRIDFDGGYFSAGLRFSHVAVDAGTVLDPVSGLLDSYDDDYQAVVGSLKALFELSPELAIYGSADMGFRAPNLSDLTRFDSARSNEIEIPATDLDPEYFLGLELGADYLGRRVSAHAAVFYTFLFDTIDRVPTGAIINGDFAVSKANVGDGWVAGVEVAFEWEFVDELFLAGQFFWLDGEADTYPTSMPFVESEPITRLQPIQALVALEWRPRDLPCWARAEVEIVGEADELNTRDQGDTQRIPPGGSPGYTLFNLRFGYEIDEGKNLFLHLENIGDIRYRIHGSGQQEAGFAAVAGFDLRF